jgi:hypothetical protein
MYYKQHGNILQVYTPEQPLSSETILAAPNHAAFKLAHAHMQYACNVVCVCGFLNVDEDQQWTGDDRVVLLVYDAAV